jgi:hypothetical protein
MTISASTESALSDLDALITTIDSALETAVAASWSAEKNLKIATLTSARDNAASAVAALRGPGSSNAGPSDQVRNKLSELGL